jgi:glycosyltransferase involved in cell wall biosynthesis
MIHLVHATGNAFVRGLLEGLEESGAEYRFWTTIASSGGGIKRLLPGRLQEQLARRSYPVPRERIATRPLREWVRLLAPGLGLKALARHERGWASVDAVYADLDRAVARSLRSVHREAQPGSWIYAYEDGALESFRAGAELGLHRAYELPIAYWETSRRLLSEEAERWPAWADTLVGPVDSDSKLERKTRELEMAEIIVVPSRFVERSLPASLKPGQRVVVAEFGSPPCGETGEPDAARPMPATAKLRVLFAGSMSQRKGLADVFQAMRMLNRGDVELVVMGSPVAPLDFYLRQGVAFTYEAPRPHAAVLQLMRTCDVLVLPSLVEGRAMVQQEALACSLPIIVTANAGGEDLVEEGRTGFLVPVRSPDSIAEKLAWLADHRPALAEMRSGCVAMAARYSWRGYARRILEPMLSPAEPVPPPTS